MSDDQARGIIRDLYLTHFDLYEVHGRQTYPESFLPHPREDILQAITLLEISPKQFDRKSAEIAKTWLADFVPDSESTLK